MRQTRTNKLSTPLNLHPLFVADKKGSLISAKRVGEATITRNMSMFHCLLYGSHKEPVLSDLQEDFPVTTHHSGEEKPDKLPQSVSGRSNPIISKPKRLFEDL